ncbi:MAG: hypothetical protein ACREMY_18870, partial [bacterium]
VAARARFGGKGPNRALTVTLSVRLCRSLFRPGSAPGSVRARLENLIQECKVVGESIVLTSNIRSRQGP